MTSESSVIVVKTIYHLIKLISILNFFMVERIIIFQYRGWDWNIVVLWKYKNVNYITYIILYMYYNKKK